MSSAQAVGVQFRNANLDVHKKDSAQRKLLALCTKVAPLRRDLTAFEDAMLGEYCVACACEDGPTLTQSLPDALRVLLKARRYNVVLVLFKKLGSLVPERVLRDAAGILPLAMAWSFDQEERWKLFRYPAPDELIDVIHSLSRTVPTSTLSTTTETLHFSTRACLDITSFFATFSKKGP